MTTKRTSENKSFWGKGIFLLYSGFVVFILSVVIFASFQDFSLEEENYYQKELVYQDKMNSIANANELEEKPFWEVDKDTDQFRLTFPKQLLDRKTEGTIHFFRPSDKKFDIYINLKFDEDGHMIIPIDELISGYWKVKLKWKSGTTEYFMEEFLTL